MHNWMKKLDRQYENTRRQYPDEKRYMIFHVLKSFDENHSTQFFDGLTVGDITVHENQILKLLARFHIPPENQEKILDWYDAYLLPHTIYNNLNKK